MSDLAGQTAGASPDLGVAHDRAAHAVVEVDVGEVAQGPRGRAVPFRPGGPVHVVVHGDRSFDVRGENLDRVKLAEQERGIGQLDQPPGAPVYRVSGAHDRQPRRPTAALLGTDDRGAQRGGYLIGVAGLPMSCSARDTVSPRASRHSATIPSGAMLRATATPTSARA